MGCANREPSCGVAPLLRRLSSEQQRKGSALRRGWTNFIWRLTMVVGACVLLYACALDTPGDVLNRADQEGNVLGGFCRPPLDPGDGDTVCEDGSVTVPAGVAPLLHNLATELNAIGDTTNGGIATSWANWFNNNQHKCVSNCPAPGPPGNPQRSWADFAAFFVELYAIYGTGGTAGLVQGTNPHSGINNHLVAIYQAIAPSLGNQWHDIGDFCLPP